MIYAWRYPESIHRSVMIAVNPPGHFLWDAKTTDEQIGRYAEHCCAGRRAAAAGRTTSPRRCRQTAADMPDRWFFLPIKDGNVRVASFFGLMETTSDAAEGPLSAPMTLDCVARRRRRRRERVLVPVAPRRSCVPRVVRLGADGRRREARRRSGERLLLLRQPEARFEPGRRGDGVHLGRRPAGRLLAGRSGRGRVQHCARVERRDAPHRRRARPRDAAAGRDGGAPPAPAERQPGRSARVRAFGRPSGRSSRRQVPT